MPVNDRKSQDRNDSGLLIWQDTMKSNIFCWKEALLVKLMTRIFVCMQAMIRRFLSPNAKSEQTKQL